ncbi:LOW QUALITY PROTEIN: uncharacterized protein, partial [Henckelia pumila]|uniref:LOW QUALITY PROTEIN: uncharacterized protein n=1 Tax=Henckelia pumila TaxID=405737 RepID=UPI003C6E97F8
TRSTLQHLWFLINSEKTPIVDKGAIGESSSLEYIYDYTTSFTLDHSSHRGLGFCELAETTPSFGSSFKIEEKDGDSIVFSSCEADRLGGDTDLVNGTKAKIGEYSLEEIPSSEENPRYVLIGGTKIYTYDTEEEEEEEELTDVERSEEADCSTTSESDELSSVIDSDIDEEVAVDYFEGIGGTGDIVNVAQLMGQVSDVSDDDSDSKDSYDETLQKFGGIALMEGSRKYGQRKPGSGIKYLAEDKKPTPIKYAGSPTLDGLMLVKDPRTASGRKKPQDKISQSWPLESRKSKNFRTIPGEKKKHRKEMIAAKRRDRMINRGVDLQQINSKLHQMVLDGETIVSFQPMHSRDCSQVRRLASIYRLGSLCSGSGKKRFVTVTRTHHTCMPCSNDKVRLEKLIGADKDDADFAVIDTMTAQVHRQSAKKLVAFGDSTSNGPKSSRARSNKQARSNRMAGKEVGSYASQPVSFVPGGKMNSETVDTENISPETKDVSKSVEVGAFEMHTTGFGSKMLAKMGFVEGGGLGKDGQGLSHPIEVVQRPKSLGLGAEVPETSTNLMNIDAPPKPARSSAKSSYANDRLAKKDTQKLGSFEQHTKGFGSKMMAKMGFVKGMGLGKDSQGMVNPLVAHRRPKAQGLGATG